MSDAAVLETRVEWADREERFGAFVVSHHERAWRLGWRLVGGDEAAAEDVTQEAFVLVPMEGSRCARPRSCSAGRRAP